jgi:hypothetical protein
LLATDYYNIGSGHINRFSLIITPYACSPASRSVAMTATKTVSGTFAPGGTIAYLVTLTKQR